MTRPADAEAAVAVEVAPMSLRSGRPASLRLALVVLLVCAVLLGGLQLAVGLGVPDNLLAIVLFVAAFWVWIAAGVTAWRRRPANATGALIVIGGITVLLSGLANLGIGVLDVVSAVFATSVLGVVVHLLHAFPSGRLHGRVSIAVVIGGYLVSLVLQAPAFLLAADPPAAVALRTVQSSLGIALMVVTSVILVGRLRAADRAHRRVLAPLFLYGSLAVILIPLTPVVVRAVGEPPAVSGMIQLALLAGVPIAFLVGVLSGGFTRTGELEALSAWLGLSGAPRPTVGRALAATLGDPSLQVVFWSAERGAFVDGAGAPAAPLRTGSGRTRLDVSVDSRLVGAIVYDNRMLADAELVRRAGEVLAIAIDRERLTAELLSTNDALFQSRLRLVETADRERTRIARDLHDGLQVQLVLLALEAQQIGNAPGASVATSRASTELRRRIDEAAAELRRLVHNVLPAALVERGLSAAAEDLVDRLAMPATLDVRIDDDSLAPATTNTAYFIIAEALTNAVKHSRARAVHLSVGQAEGRLSIEVSDDGIGGATLGAGAGAGADAGVAAVPSANTGTGAGTGLKGLADRVDVLGGTFSLDSPPGGGTRIRVELPCGS